MMSMLGIFAAEMGILDVPYEYMRYTSTVNGAYWVGEYTDTPTTTEDGHKEGTLLLTGTTRGTWLELEQVRAKIERHFPTIYGLRKSTDNGAVVFYYDNAFPVDTGEADLKRIQINVKVKEWRND